MQPLITHSELQARPEIIRSRWVYGIFYGAAVALAFAAWTWGLDAYMLSQANVMHPWAKFIIGLLVSLPVGAIAGWVTMRFERGWVAALAWLPAALVFAWMAVALPFLYGPQWVLTMNQAPIAIPESIYADLFMRLGIAFIWCSFLKGRRFPRWAATAAVRPGLRGWSPSR